MKKHCILGGDTDVYKISYMENLKYRKNVYKMFAIAFGIAIVFLMLMYAMANDKIGRLQDKITALESAAQESMIFVPDGRDGHKEFEIVKRF